MSLAMGPNVSFMCSQSRVLSRKEQPSGQPTRKLPITTPQWMHKPPKYSPSIILEQGLEQPPKNDCAQRTCSQESQFCGSDCYLVVSCVQLFCDLENYSPPGSSVHGILQARILEQVVISFSRGSSQPRNGTYVFCISRQILYH